MPDGPSGVHLRALGGPAVDLRAGLSRCSPSALGTPSLSGRDSKQVLTGAELGQAVPGEQGGGEACIPLLYPLCGHGIAIHPDAQAESCPSLSPPARFTHPHRIHHKSLLDTPTSPPPVPLL